MRTLALLTATVCLAGCGGSAEADARPTVVAAVYPLAWAVEQVAGTEFRVVNLTSAGAEPHDLELSPSDIETIRDAELVVYVGQGFQPAVEDAVAARPGASLDVLHGDSDLHIWLDFARFARTVAEIARTVEDVTLAGPTLRRLGLLDGEYRRGLARCERSTLVTSHAAFGPLAGR